VQLAPQLAEQLNALFTGGNSSGRDRTRSEFDRLKDDPSLTPEQKQQLQNLQSFYNAGVEAGYFTEPGGADTVVGGGDSAKTPVVLQWRAWEQPVQERLPALQVLQGSTVHRAPTKAIVIRRAGSGSEDRRR